MGRRSAIFADRRGIAGIASEQLFPRFEKSLQIALMSIAKQSDGDTVLTCESQSVNREMSEAASLGEK